MPTIRTSEFTVLQIVGLDAAVVRGYLILLSTTSNPNLQLLNFFKMSFYLFSVCSMFAITIIMPLNWKVRAAPSTAPLRSQPHPP
jgi:hypothetical protein